MKTAFADDDERRDAPEPLDPAEQGRYGNRDLPTGYDDYHPDDPEDPNPPAARQSDR